MQRDNIIRAYVFSLSLAVIFISGCVYLTHFDEAMFVKGLDNSQKEMQAQLDEEKKLYDKLKTDINNGRLKKLMRKRAIFSRYGEPTLCNPAEADSSIRETCIYRQPLGGLSAGLILLNLDAQGRLYSWQVQEPEKQD